MNPRTSIKKSPLIFFVLVFALSIPIWLVGGYTGHQLLPGIPVSSLWIFCPLIAALILVYGENKTVGVVGLLKRSLDYKRIKAKIWYIPIILLMPGAMIVEYGLMRLMGTPVPAFQLPVRKLIILFFAFFITGLGEELGWLGYAIEPMQDSSNALQASLLLGFVWASMHLVPLAQAHRTPDWIAWQFLTIVAERILFVWLYNNTGKSIFAAAVFHSMLNVSWQLFPINGSFYDPTINGLIMISAAIIVSFLWGPKTLARYRYTRLNMLDAKG